MIMLKWTQKPTPYEEQTFAYLICNFNQEVEKEKRFWKMEKWWGDKWLCKWLNYSPRNLLAINIFYLSELASDANKCYPFNILSLFCTLLINMLKLSFKWKEYIRNNINCLLIEMNQIFRPKIYQHLESGKIYFVSKNKFIFIVSYNKYE